jgi:hypothetical protein
VGTGKRISAVRTMSSSVAKDDIVELRMGNDSEDVRYRGKVSGFDGEDAIVEVDLEMRGGKTRKILTRAQVKTNECIKPSAKPKIPKRVTPNDVAKRVKKELKEHFPDTKFSVRIQAKGTFTTVTASWVDGPLRKDVAKITDGYDGVYENGTELEVFAHRKFSEDAVKKVAAELAGEGAWDEDLEIKEGPDGAHIENSFVFYDLDGIERNAKNYVEKALIRRDFTKRGSAVSSSMTGPVSGDYRDLMVSVYKIYAEDVANEYEKKLRETGWDSNKGRLISMFGNQHRDILLLSKKHASKIVGTEVKAGRLKEKDREKALQQITGEIAGIADEWISKMTIKKVQ